MSGQIILESEFGKGSTFSILFPLVIFTGQKTKKDSETDIINESEKEFELTSQPEILMVDNDEASREITRLFLKNICKVDFAVSGEEALKLTGNNSYKLILMDINLGVGLSGIETTQKIRNIEAYKNIPIIALTAFALAGEKEEFLKFGCTHYLSKPFLKKELIDLITDIL
jgi:CheY-like chemotaxis protein